MPRLGYLKNSIAIRLTIGVNKRTSCQRFFKSFEICALQFFTLYEMAKFNELNLSALQIQHYKRYIQFTYR